MKLDFEFDFMGAYIRFLTISSGLIFAALAYNGMIILSWIYGVVFFLFCIMDTLRDKK
jgi:hypothetical protein